MAMRPKRIAVLGGGMASLVTLLKLTELEDWKSQFEFDVYQMGWRLGGKGASGRLQNDGVEGSSTHRIVEHGLHMLFGFYENTFQVLRKVIDDAARLGWKWSFDQSFVGHDQLVMFEHFNGSWLPWIEELPRRPGDPGITAPGALVDESADFYLRGLLDLLCTFRGLSEPGDDDVAKLSKAMNGIELGALIQSVSTLAEAEVLEHGAVREILDHLSKATQAGLDDATAYATPATRRFLLKLHMMAVIGVGYLAEFGADKPDWFKLDDYDYRDWLMLHGAHRALIESPLVTGLYAGAYSADDRYGAGTCVHCLLDALLRQKGHAMYKMQAGMGDVIFAPIYEVLSSRGVRFHFFHRVEALHLSADRSRVERIDIDVQARLVGDTYDPRLREIGENWAWPAEPRVEQLKEGDEVKDHNLENWWDTYKQASKELVVGRDFHDVLLGISVGAFPYICRELIDDPRNPDFAAMVFGIKTTLTQSAQLWFDRKLEDLGWTAKPPVAIPFARPFDTWADMTHLTRQEKLEHCACIAYLTSSLQDPADDPPPPRVDAGYPGRLRERVRENLRNWLSQSAAALWPNLVDQGRVRDGWLANPGAQPDPLHAQWVIAADNPSDRYNLAVPGSNRRRLGPGQSGYENLVLCGDWTLNSLSVGCLESATMSGIEAAHVLSSGKVGLPINHWLPPSAPGKRRPGNGFVQRDGALLAPPPVGLDVRLFVFELPARYASIAGLCDRELNLPGSPVRYRPASRIRPIVLFYASDLVNLVPGGSVPERDFGFWVPLVRSFEGRSQPVVYSPYLWVDSSPALLNGVTVFGFNKQFGTMTMPVTPDDHFEIDLSAWYQPTVHAPVEQGEFLKLRFGDGAGADPRSRRASREVLASLDALSPEGEWAEYFRSIREFGMRQVFLKQFMKADGTFSAAHQEILETNIAFQLSRQIERLHGEWSLTIRHTASHSIAPKLGLENADYQRTPYPHWLIRGSNGLFLSFVANVEPANRTFP